MDQIQHLSGLVPLPSNSRITIMFKVLPLVVFHTTVAILYVFIIYLFYVTSSSYRNCICTSISWYAAEYRLFQKLLKFNSHPYDIFASFLPCTHLDLFSKSVIISLLMKYCYQKVLRFTKKFFLPKKFSTGCDV